MACFFRVELNPTVAGVICLLQRVGHSYRFPTSDVSQKSFNIVPGDLFGEALDEESGVVGVEPKVGGFGDIYGGVEVDFDGLVVKEAGEVLVVFFLIFNIWDDPNLFLNK